MSEQIKFLSGNIYSCTSTYDSKMKFRYQIVRRTDKSVWLRRVIVFRRHSPDMKPLERYTAFGHTKRVKIGEWDGSECVSPEGRYSMSPIIQASTVGITLNNFRAMLKGLDEEVAA